MKGVLLLLIGLLFVNCNVEDIMKTLNIVQFGHIPIGEINYNGALWYSGSIEFTIDFSTKCVFLFKDGEKTLYGPEIFLKDKETRFHFSGTWVNIENVGDVSLYFGCIGIADTKIYRHKFYLYEVKSLQDLESHEHLVHMFKYIHKPQTIILK